MLKNNSCTMAFSYLRNSQVLISTRAYVQCLNLNGSWNSSSTVDTDKEKQRGDYKSLGLQGIA